MPSVSQSIHHNKETWFEWFAYHALAFFLALGLSLLSFVGLLQLLPITSLGIAAFIFTAVIVVSVYRPSIKKGLKRLFAREYSQREQAKWALMRDFDEQTTKSVDRENGDQLTEYVQSVLGGTDAHDHPLITVKIATLSQWQIRSTSFFCFLLALCAGISLFITIAGQAVGLHGAIMTILSFMHVKVAASIAVSVAMSSGIGLAALAAIPFVFVVYHTLMQLFNHPRVLAWKRQFFSYIANSEISKIRRFSLAFAVVLTVIISIAATVFTAGGWWHAAQAGAQVLPGLTVVWHKLAMITTPFYALAFFSFSITHSVEAVSKFIKKLGEQFSHHDDDCETTSSDHDKSITKHEDKPYWKIFNPVRMLMKLISVPLKFTIFVLHNVAEALINVKEGGLMGLLATIFIAIDDFLTEVNEVFLGHSHGTPSNVIDKALKQGKSREVHSEQSTNCEGCPMDHIIWLLLVPVLLVFHPFNALWDRLWSGSSYFECLKSSWSEFHSFHDCGHGHGHGHDQCKKQGHDGCSGHGHGHDQCKKQGHDGCSGHGHGHDQCKKQGHDGCSRHGHGQGKVSECGDNGYDQRVDSANSHGHCRDHTDYNYSQTSGCRN